jgi:hypothetical protein
LSAMFAAPLEAPATTRHRAPPVMPIHVKHPIKGAAGRVYGDGTDPQNWPVAGDVLGMQRQMRRPEGLVDLGHGTTHPRRRNSVPVVD